MRRIAVLLVLFSLVSVKAASSQTAPSNAPQILACPPDSIPVENRRYPVWGPSGVGVKPVLPALLPLSLSGGAVILSEVAAYMRGPMGNEPEARKAQLLQGHQRLKKVVNVEAFTAPGSDLSNLPDLPADFYEEFKQAGTADNLEYGILPCGTLLHYLSSAGPDLVVDGTSTPQISVLPEHVIGWYESGFLTPDGKPGVRIVRTKKLMTIGSGPNKGVSFRFLMIIRCGNPTTQFEVPNEVVTVPAETPPLAGGLILPPAGSTQGTLPKVGSGQGETKPRGKAWIPCISNYTWAACLGGALLAAHPWNRGGEATIASPIFSGKIGGPGGSPP